jgi:hypothetical protein
MEVTAKTYTLDDAIDVLFDGDRDAMTGLICPYCLKPYSYIFSERADSMDVHCACEGASMYKIGEVPNCVKLFGKSHSFT